MTAIDFRHVHTYRRTIRARRRARLSLLARDAAIVLAVLALYFLARGLAPNPIDRAVAVSDRIVRIERALHIFVEPSVQAWSLRHHWLTETANVIYAYFHFPVMALVAVWLWWRGRERFLLMRNALFVSMLIGLVFYWTLPAAPPRLMALHGRDLGFVDTLFGGETAVSYAQPSLILNEYAAIPSFHFGWILLSAMAIWVNTNSRALRVLAAALLVSMTWAIVASANHFVIDMALGGAVILGSWVIAGRLARTGGSRLAPTPVPFAAAMIEERRAA